MATRKRETVGDQAVAASTAALSVRTRTLTQRFRAGFGPFGREAAVVQATPAQAELLHADPELIVSEQETV